jgi:hypothetical protein
VHSWYTTSWSKNSDSLVSCAFDQVSCLRRDHGSRYQAYYSFYPRNPVYERSLDSSVLPISLSLHRHPFVCILFTSRFTCYNNKSKNRYEAKNLTNKLKISCNIELQGYLANEAGPVPLVLDLRIVHDRVGSRADPTLNGHLNYPKNLDQSFNDAASDKIQKYRVDYNNRPPSVVSFMSAIPSTSGRLHSEFVRLLFLQSHRETDRFFAASGVQSAQSTSGGFFHFRRAAFSSGLKSKVGLALAKTPNLRIVLNLDGVSIASKSHTHPSHSQTSRLLTSSLSFGVPVPRPTQCVRGE